MTANYICEYIYTVKYPTIPSDVPFHKHKCYELIYFPYGSGCVRANSRQFNYLPGTIIIIPPEEPHYEAHYSPTTAICVGFSSLANTVYCSETILISNLASRINYMVLEELVSENDARQSGYQEKMTCLLNSLLIDCGRCIKTCPDSHPENIEDIRLENLEKDDDIKSIWKQYVSAYSTYSYDRFRHIFRERMGISPNQFIVNLRIKKAKYMLNYTTQSVIAIAFACGYSNSSYFTRQFRKETGLTPSEFRETMNT